MNGNRARFSTAGALCLALCTGAAYGQSGAPTTVDRCAKPSVRTNVRPDADGTPTEVSVGVRLIDLTKINDVAQTLTGDFFVLLIWTDARLSHLMGCKIALDHVWSPGLTFINSGRMFTSRVREVHIGPGGQVRYGQRYYGTLATYGNLRDFPFDKQEIVVGLMPLQWPEDDVRFIIDDNVTGRRDLLNITGWKILDVSAKLTREHVNLFGRFHSRFDFQITAHRITAYYTWKIILPLCLIVAMSWCVFWINPARFGPQIGLSATSMLTLIAFIFATTSMVPKLGYFTILDLFIIGATVLVFLALIQSLTTSYLVSMERTVLATRIDRICRIVFPLAFATHVFIVLLR